MRQFAAVLILVALFLLLVGSRFKASDGDKLRAVSRSDRDQDPERTTTNDQRGRSRGRAAEGTADAPRRRGAPRLAADKRFVGVEFKVTAEGNVVTLRGVVPDTRLKSLAVEVAGNTVGVERVVDELAVPAPRGE